MASEPGLTAFATFVCKCGWLMCATTNELVHCENPKCSRRATAYRIIVKLEEVEVKTV